ncbi:MAG: tetratricopeptide repeat protein [Candidatus Rokuibacteriota bacterium]
MLTGDNPGGGGLGGDCVETLHRLGILLDAGALDAHRERVATAFSLLAAQRLSEAAAELHRARLAAPALTTTWLVEAVTLLRTGATRASRALLEQYLARWPGDPAATALLEENDQGSRIGDQRGRVVVLAASVELARELAVRADECVERIRALCGYPPHPTLILRVTEFGETSGRCLRGGSPFARLIELSAGGLEDSTLLAHELVHATLSSSNLAFTEGLALYVSTRLCTPWNDTCPVAEKGDIGREVERLFLDLDGQADSFDCPRQALARVPRTMPHAYWLAFLGTTALVVRVGLVAFVDYLQWLRDPTPAPALAAQEQLYRFHFGSSLRAALRSTGASQLTS